MSDAGSKETGHYNRWHFPFEITSTELSRKCFLFAVLSIYKMKRGIVDRDENNVTYCTTALGTPS
jgi:hypothetical protein